MYVIVYSRRGEVFGVGDYHPADLADMRRAFGFYWKETTREKANYYELNPDKLGAWMGTVSIEKSHRQKGSEKTMRRQQYLKRLEKVRQMLIAGALADDIYDAIKKENHNFRRASLLSYLNEIEKDGTKCR